MAWVPGAGQACWQGTAEARSPAPGRPAVARACGGPGRRGPRRPGAAGPV